ncbi:hypothetical protein GLAREA_02676 [Glarea lozoyensis ATCC 20868]|uniref:Putative gamma-glutamylcyclotransferase n=1 Tax=Glarea lozoyensis (strain ATCC 20868 / MF5171) TaxID=1116229 RepID=S3CJS8_GLAL2|nr:uncharacterized protein GLAREA_02676 [Glarea lozoyensis ATCC 20868]EPE26762.1 hypothetical protein GLAREA_02676 [Glarea lozoyensis ATCC 20868]
MNLLNELEQLADTSIYKEDGEIDTVKMWQERFGYSYEEAAALTAATKLSDDAVVRERSLSPAEARRLYILKLEGPIDNAAKVQVAGDLPTIPEIYHDEGEGARSIFCKVDGRAKVTIEHWLSSQKSSFRPLFVPVGAAYKELSPDTLYPTLGKDTTLPQFRPQAPLASAPTQDQYPVWYFFYGTLASVPKLVSLFSLREDDDDDIPVLRKASVIGGEMKTWGQGKYNALVDGQQRIQGSAYHVRTKDHEDALRKYETEAYEVVRCSIDLEDGSVVQGCTFRFTGEVD